MEIELSSRSLPVNPNVPLDMSHLEWATRSLDLEISRAYFSKVTRQLCLVPLAVRLMK